MPLVEDRRKLSTRLTVLQYGIAVAFCVLAVSFWAFQIVQHEKFAEMAENNHQRTLALRAPRGLVFDRDGRVLVENRHSYSVSIVREHTRHSAHHRLLADVLAVARRPPGRSTPSRAGVPAVMIVRTRRWRSRRHRPSSRFELPDVVIERCRPGGIEEMLAARISSASSARRTIPRSPATIR